MVADPINAATGNNYLQQSDYTDSPWLTLRRFYNSDGNTLSVTMGAHWRHSFERSLQLSGSSGTVITAYRSDSTGENFSKANGRWVSDPDSADTLDETDDANGVATGYALTIASLRHVERYDSYGVLQSITDDTQNGVMLTYSTTATSATVAPTPGLLITVTDTSNRQLQFFYNSGGDVSQVVLPDGGNLIFDYDSSGRLTSTKYPDNRTRQYVYNESALTGGANLLFALTGVIDESGTRYVSTAYDSTGRAISSSFPGGADKTSIAYNNDGTSSIQYPLGLTSTMGFTVVQGVIQASSLNEPCAPQCNQSFKSQTFDPHGYPLSVTDFNNNLTTTHYDGNGLLYQRIDASGTSVQRTTNTQWDTILRHPLSRAVLDANGNTASKTRWVYNAIGQPLAYCEVDPQASYTCSKSGSVPTGVRRWTYTYCDTVDAAQCPRVGLMLSATGPRTDLIQTTTYTYYTNNGATSCGTPGSACHQPGDLYQIKDALGHLTTYASYDGAGRVTRITNTNGVYTDMTYTPRGWLATRTVGGAVTTFGYDAMGNLTSIQDPDGIATTFTYDTAHRLTDITDAQGNDIHYTLDAAGNKTGEQTRTASGTVVRSVSRTFNGLGQLTALTDGLKKSVFNAGYSDSYDANGNLTHTSDGLGVQREMSFDALNRLNSTLDNYNGADTATANTETVVAQDALDRVVGVGDPSNLNTLSTYDGLSNRTKLQSPDTGTSSDTFDAAGNQLTHTDARGIVSTSSYDALDRVVATRYADTSLNVAYNYDEPNAVTGCPSSWSAGRLTRVVETNVTTTYCYNSRGKVLQKKQTTNGVADTSTYTYTSADRLSTVTTPDSTAITYAFNSDGLPNSVTVAPIGSTAAATAVNAVTYLPFGPITSYVLGNGQQVTRTYDANYQVTDIVSPGFTLHLAREGMGKVSAIGDASGASPATENYTYDALYRLSSITDAGAAVEGYTYNQTGDRLSKTGSGMETGAYLYTAGTHQVSKIGTNTRASDANGNTISSQTGGGMTYGFSYNERNRESLAQLNGLTVGNYTYNAMGQRVGKTTQSTPIAASPTLNGSPASTANTANTERYSYDETNSLIGEYGTTNRDYIWLGNLPIATIDNVAVGSVTQSTVNYVTADQLNTPRAVANESGTVIWSWAYKGNPFGEQAPAATSDYVLNLRYPGQYYDAETATNYNLFRNYEPTIGRYQQSDPIGLSGGISMYAYVGNDPLSYSDPLGLSWDGYVSINSPGVQSQLASNIGNHYYSLWIPLCADGCTTTDAFNAMRNFSAPFAPPAQDGIHKVNLYGITSSNPIKQTVDPCRQTIVNETLTGHLFGGSVTISILQENGVIGAQIVGTGLGPNPVTNQLMGPVIFEGLGFRARESLQGSGP